MAYQNVNEETQNLEKEPKILFLNIFFMSKALKLLKGYYQSNKIQNGRLNCKQNNFFEIFFTSVNLSKQKVILKYFFMTGTLTSF